MIRLDGDAVRLARLDLGLSQRALARAVGLSNTAFITIENADPNPGSELTLAHLQRLVDALGVPLLALLADDSPQPPADHRAHAPERGPDDMAALGALLLHTYANTPKRELADALGWTLDRLRLAAAALDHHLRPLGMHVHTLRGGYLLRPHDGYKVQTRVRVDRLTTARTGMSTVHTELVHQALTGGHPTKNIGPAQRTRLSAFLRDGVLVLDEDGTARPGPALIDALDVPAGPDPSDR